MAQLASHNTTDQVHLVWFGGDVRIVNIHEAKAQLSRLVDAAAKGEGLCLVTGDAALADYPAAVRVVGR
jgi:hypothetical protein